MKGIYRFIPRFFFNWFLFSCSFFCILVFRRFHQIKILNENRRSKRNAGLQNTLRYLPHILQDAR